MTTNNDALGDHGAPPDLVVEIEHPAASLVLVRGNTEAGREWLDANVAPDAMRLAGRVACEPRYLAPLVDGAVCDGLTVATEGNADG
jgi:hypothetical protein